ncbi:putative LRR receptor-like serine/threonine-protein kinase [Arachis hypogaea]|nr:putative LRR receptor-like serine/threonine-protein kinase [Arachis hypogaea]
MVHFTFSRFPYSLPSLSVEDVTSSAITAVAAHVTRAPSVALIAFAPFVAIVVRPLSAVLLSYELLPRRSRRCFFSPRRRSKPSAESFGYCSWKLEALREVIMAWQVVGIQGHNPSGHCLVASKLVDSILPTSVADDKDLNPAKKLAIDKSQPIDITSKKTELSMIIAAGPFTTTDNLFFEPLVEFSGEIPNSLGGLKNLNYLRLNNNSLTGPCPQSLSNIEGLTLVDLSYNNLSGSLPRIPARTLNLVLQTNQELDHDEKLSFRHQMGPPVANSPPVA